MVNGYAWPMERVRVLVVDDSPTTRTMLREALALDGGIEVVGEANGGKEAILNADALNPDVVLLDVRMPEGDGVQAARYIASHHPGPRSSRSRGRTTPTPFGTCWRPAPSATSSRAGPSTSWSARSAGRAAGEPELDQKVLPAAMDDLRRLLEEEKGRREEVERLSKAKAEFIQVLSHELRTPLTVISGALRMLERSGVGPDEEPLVESALRRAGELEFLVEGLELVGTGPSIQGVAYPSKRSASRPNAWATGRTR